MNINFLPQIQNKNVQNLGNSTVTGSNHDLNRNVSYPNLRPLAKDTISFGISQKSIKAAFETDYSSKIPMLKEMAIRLSDTLAGVCAEVEGAVYDLEYCKKAMTKSLERYIEKFKDSGAVPMDRVRSTVFIKDLYDFSIISKFIKIMEERGFYILPTPAGKTGKSVTKWNYDFDIRLNNADGKLVSQDEIRKLPEHLRNNVSKKQKSGYGDIQVRFVDASHLPLDKRTPTNLSKLIPQEVLFVFGKETANAKTKESEYVYNITRSLDKMYIANVETSGNRRSPAAIVQGNLECIGSILRSNISKPLYENAERVDVYGKEPLLQPSLTKNDEFALKGFMHEIEIETENFYKTQFNRISSPSYKKEIEEMIKSSPEFKSSKQRRVTSADIEEKRNELLRELQEHRNEDSEKIVNQMNALKKTIKEFLVKS